MSRPNSPKIAGSEVPGAGGAPKPVRGMCEALRVEGRAQTLAVDVGHGTTGQEEDRGVEDMQGPE